MGVLATQSRAAEFREILGRRALLADGGMGTMLLAKGAFASRSLDELNRSLPALVRDVHQEYLRAGAEILRTNTFGANRKRLELFGFGDKVWHINQAGARIAREAAREQAFVAGCVGPLGVPLAPLGPLVAEEAHAMFRQQIGALVEAGVDLLVLETFRNLAELRQAVEAAREAAGTEMIVAAHVSVDGDGSLADGSSPEDFARSMEEMPADVLGVNCSSGPAAVLEALERMAGFTRKPLSASPSAGVGKPCSPAYLARYAQRFLRIGAKLVSGCCGAGPEHIRTMRAEIRDFTPGEAALQVEVREPETRPAPLEPIVLPSRSALGAKLSAREFITLMEIETTCEAGSSHEVAAARRIKDAGADAVLVTARPGAKSAGAVCQAIQQQAGIDAILQVGEAAGPRAIQGELLGASALGLHNIVVTGGAGIYIARNLNRGLDLGGHPLGSQTAFVIGVRLDSGSDAEAVSCADFALIPPVFDLDLLGPWELSKLPLIAGIRPLASYRDAEFLLNERHIPIPAEIMARMQVAISSDAARAEGAAIARDIAERLRGRVAGASWSPGE